MTEFTDKEGIDSSNSCQNQRNQLRVCVTLETVAELETILSNVVSERIGKSFTDVFKTQFDDGYFERVDEIMSKDALKKASSDKSSKRVKRLSTALRDELLPKNSSQMTNLKTELSIMSSIEEIKELQEEELDMSKNKLQ